MTAPLPSSEEAELAAIGCIVEWPAETIPFFVARAAPALFFNPVLQMVCALAIELFEAKGTYDLTTLTQYLGDVGHLDQVGGPASIANLYSSNTPVSMLPYYIEILEEKYNRRSLIQDFSALVTRARDEQDDFGAIVGDAQKQAQLLGKGSHRTRLPKLLDVSQCLGNNKPPRPSELVERVLHQGSKLVLGGTSKGRKTFALIDLALSVACGAEWWGFKCAQGPVCYINFEIQESFFYERVDKICDAKQVTLQPEMLMGWHLRGHADAIERLMEELLPVLRTKKFVLVIVDPIYKALGNRDENKAGDVASMLNELERIAVLTGAAVVFGAHFSKGNQAAKESIDRIGGSGTFGRDSDSILTMTPHSEEDAFTVESTLRNFKPLPPFVVEWQFPIFQVSPDLDPKALRQPHKGSRAATDSAAVLLPLIIRTPLRFTEFQRAAFENLGINSKAFEKYLSILKKDGRIVKVDDGWIAANNV